jgi:hypothetical protein
VMLLTVPGRTAAEVEKSDSGIGRILTLGLAGRARPHP